MMAKLRKLLSVLIVLSPLVLVAADGDCEPTTSCTADVDCQGGTLTCDPPAYPACVKGYCSCTE